MLISGCDSLQTVRLERWLGRQPNYVQVYREVHFDAYMRAKVHKFVILSRTIFSISLPLSQEYDAAREFHVARLGQKLQPGKR
jgi:hypothetical protein